MLKPTGNAYPSMTDEERKQFESALAEEAAAKEDNIAAAKMIAPKVVEACAEAVAIIQQLREAREAVGISLSELAARTGILKSALSRLENSKAPNPTLAYLQRYASAIDSRIVIALEPRTGEP
jgi:ribosome-binding protein aMBF1 (putative translation factor)